MKRDSQGIGIATHILSCRSDCAVGSPRGYRTLDHLREPRNASAKHFGAAMLYGFGLTAWQECYIGNQHSPDRKREKGGSGGVRIWEEAGKGIRVARRVTDVNKQTGTHHRAECRVVDLPHHASSVSPDVALDRSAHPGKAVMHGGSMHSRECWHPTPPSGHEPRSRRQS